MISQSLAEQNQNYQHSYMTQQQPDYCWIFEADTDTAVWGYRKSDKGLYCLSQTIPFIQLDIYEI